MGNTPSSTNSNTQIATSSVLPPLPPPCDLECEKKKKLVLLKSAFDSADPKTDPEGYNKARIAYYTLLKGQGWLQQEKQRIAKEELEPILTSYKQQYDAYKGEQQTQSVFSNLASMLDSQSKTDEADGSFLNKKIMMEKDKVATFDRLNQMNTPTSSTNYISWAIDILITLMGIFVLYKGYIFMSSRFFTSQTVPDLTSTY